MTAPNSDSETLDKRTDLASLFCMIARHGPAAAVALISAVSLLAAFVLYRSTVRKMRAKAAPSAAQTEARSGGERTDATVKQGEDGCVSAESTDVEDGVSPDRMKNLDLSEDPLKIQPLCAAALDEDGSLTVLQADEKTTQDLSFSRWDDDLLEDIDPGPGEPEPLTAAETHKNEVSPPLSESEAGEDEEEEEEEEEDTLSPHQDVQDEAQIEVSSYKSSGWTISTENDQRQDEEQVRLKQEVTPNESLPHINKGQEEDKTPHVMTNILGQTPDRSEKVDSVGSQVGKPSWVNGVQEEQRQERPSAESVNSNDTAEEERRKGEREEGISQPRIIPQTLILPTTQEDSHTSEVLSTPPDQHVPDICDVYDEEELETMDEEEVPVRNLTAAECDPLQLQTEDEDDENVLPNVAEGQETNEMTNGSVHACFAEETDGFNSSVSVLDHECDVGQVSHPDGSFSDEPLPPNQASEETPSLRLSPFPLEEPHLQNGKEFSESDVNLQSAAAEHVEDTLHPSLSCPQQDTTGVSPESNLVSDSAPWDHSDVPLSVYNNNLSCAPTLPACQNQQNGQRVNDEIVPADLSADEVPACPRPLSPCQDQQVGQGMENAAVTASVSQPSDQMAKSEAEAQKEEIVDAGPDALAAVEAEVAAWTIDDDSPGPEQPFFFPTQENIQRGAMGESPAVPCEVDGESSGADQESGVSSMAFSPDSEEPSEDLSCPMMDLGHQSIHAHCVFSERVTNEDESLSSMVFVEEDMRWSSGGNEDMFGQDIEDSYHEDFEFFMAQIVAEVVSRIDDPGEPAQDKNGVEMKEERTGAQMAKGGKKQAETEEDEDNQRTEISIMEATMDNNEWMEDMGSQVLPWMTSPFKPVDRGHTKSQNKLDSDVAVAAAAVSMDPGGVDIQSSTEDKQSCGLSVADDNNKRVVAVSPMPQNVNVTFCVHYLTSSPHQTVAVTGDRQELGGWRGFIPLERAKDGYWASVVGLPAESRVEWKFVLVDEDEISRWEECENRYLQTGSGEDLYVRKWWGFL